MVWQPYHRPKFMFVRVHVSYMILSQYIYKVEKPTFYINNK